MIRICKTGGRACSKGIGTENIVWVKPAMGGEDFSYYLQKVPGAFFRLGNRNEAKGTVHPYHRAFLMSMRISCPWVWRCL